MNDFLVTPYKKLVFKRTKLLRTESNPYISETNMSIIEDNFLDYKYMTEIFNKISCCASTSFICDGLSLVVCMVVFNIIYWIIAFFLQSRLKTNLYWTIGSMLASLVYLIIQCCLYYYYSVYTTRKLIRVINKGSEAFQFDISLLLDIGLTIKVTPEPGSGFTDYMNLADINPSVNLVNIFQPTIKSFSNQGDAYEENREIDHFVNMHFPTLAAEIVEEFYSERNASKCCIQFTFIVSLIATIICSILLWNKTIYRWGSNYDLSVGIYVFVITICIFIIYYINNALYSICIKSNLISEKGYIWKQKGYFIERAGVDILTILEYNTDISNFDDSALSLSAANY